MIEFNPFFKKYRPGLKKVAVIYPNRYIGGITNLGLQRIYYEINKSEEFVAERFYTDVERGLRSVEFGIPLNYFDIALISIQYEEDYFNALKILRESKFSGRVVVGGPCVTENPFSFYDFFDRFFLGEAENVVIDVIKDASVEGLMPFSKRRRVSKLDNEMKMQIISTNAYGKSILIEIGRGCYRSCRFCIVRQIYRPARWRKKEDVIEIAEVNRKFAEKVALIAPSPTDHPQFKDIVSELIQMGFEVSPSSIRADRFDEEVAELLPTKSLTLAPEAGSDKLREILNKGIDEEDVLNAVRISKAEKIKLYFMYGLPFEKKEDLDGIIKLVEKVRSLGKKVSVSLNPLVPKPHTPFQWLPFGGNPEKSVKKNIEELKWKREYLISHLRKICEVNADKIDDFAIQTIISRGVRLRLMKKISLNRILKSDLSRLLGCMDVDSPLPWDEIEMGYKKEKLKREFEKIL
uniref:Radical SAM protein n=1 Tax=Geoglobus ahangari TaxID=113653 RepID=A0A7C3YFJ7_9EURY